MEIMRDGAMARLRLVQPSSGCRPLPTAPTSTALVLWGTNAGARPSALLHMAGGAHGRVRDPKTH